MVKTVALFTQHLCIFSGAVVRLFSADGDSHRVKHLRLTACNSHRKLALRLLERCDVHVMLMTSVFPQVFPLLI